MIGNGQLFLLVLVPVVIYAVVIALIWMFFRYFIRLVKANESISDSLEEITELLKEKNNSGLPKEENKQIYND